MDDEPLPELKDFQAIEAEPEPPEPWWKRYYAYAFFTLACGVGFGVYINLEENGVIGTSHRVRTPSYTQEEKDKITLERTELAAVVGIIFGIAGSFTYEMGIKKNNGKPSAEASEEN